jgi:hypothetical protein
VRGGGDGEEVTGGVVVRVGPAREAVVGGKEEDREEPSRRRGDVGCCDDRGEEEGREEEEERGEGRTTGECHSRDPGRLLADKRSSRLARKVQFVRSPGMRSTYAVRA